MSKLYDRLIRSLESQGYFAVPMTDQSEERVICASRKQGDLLRGNTFWVTFKGGSWFLVTWAPVYYKMPDESTLISACIDFLNHGNRTLAQLPEHLIIQHRAKEVREESFEEVKDTAKEEGTA